MEEKKNSTTLQVSKDIQQKIKESCRKSGKGIGEWCDAAFYFINKNGWLENEMWDMELTPSLPIRDKEPNQIELIRSTMSEQLLPIIQQINPTRLLEMGANTGKMEGKIETLQEQINKIEKEKEALQRRLDAAISELKRIEREQKTIGKIKINIPCVSL